MSLAIEQRPRRLPLSLVCEVLELNRSSVYLRKHGFVGDTNRCRKQSPQPRALSESERLDVLNTLHSEAYRYGVRVWSVRLQRFWGRGARSVSELFICY